VLAITSCGPFLGVPAIVLARKARREIEDSQGQQDGAGLAQAGRIMGWVGSALYGLFFVGMGVLVAVGIFLAANAPDEASVDYLPTGSCFDGPPDLAIHLIDSFPCTISHDNEIFAAVPVEGGEGVADESVLPFLQRECEERFATFTGRALDEAATFDVAVILAPAGSWTSEANGLCVLTDREGPTRGTAELDDE
jgi:hypothetical protein